MRWSTSAARATPTRSRNLRPATKTTTSLFNCSRKRENGVGIHFSFCPLAKSRGQKLKCIPTPFFASDKGLSIVNRQSFNRQSDPRGVSCLCRGQDLRKLRLREVPLGLDHRLPRV